MPDPLLATYEVDRGDEDDGVDGGKLAAGGGAVLHSDTNHPAQHTDNLGVRQHLGQAPCGLVLLVAWGKCITDCEGLVFSSYQQQRLRTRQTWTLLQRWLQPPHR